MPAHYSFFGGPGLLEHARLKAILDLLTTSCQAASPVTLHMIPTQGATVAVYQAVVRLDRMIRRRGQPQHFVIESHPTDVGAMIKLASDFVWEAEPLALAVRTMLGQSSAAIVAPTTARESVTDFAWLAMRMARQMRRRIVRVQPDGALVEE